MNNNYIGIAIIAVADKPDANGIVLTKEGCINLANNYPEKYKFDSETNQLIIIVKDKRIISKLMNL